MRRASVMRAIPLKRFDSTYAMRRSMASPYSFAEGVMGRPTVSSSTRGSAISVMN